MEINCVSQVCSLFQSFDLSHLNKCQWLCESAIFIYIFPNSLKELWNPDRDVVKYRIIEVLDYGAMLWWRWHKEVMTRTRWYNDDDAIAMFIWQDGAIARSFIVTQSSSLCYIFAIVPSHHRRLYRTIESSLQRSRPRWCDSDLWCPIRIPYFFLINVCLLFRFDLQSEYSNQHFFGLWKVFMDIVCQLYLKSNLGCWIATQVLSNPKSD